MEIAGVAHGAALNFCRSWLSHCREPLQALSNKRLVHAAFARAEPGCQRPRIFEALTAGDRPYKKAMTLSQALTILGRMKEDNHVDPDLFEVFMREKIYLEYANKFLGPDQIDDVDLSAIPGYVH